MKNILKSLIILILILTTGCGGVSDSDYIATVKSLNLNNESMDEIANRMLRQSEFYLLNKNSLAFEDHQIRLVVLSYQIYPNELFKQIKSANPMLPELKNLKWKIDGKTKKGKVVAVSTDLVLVKIPTEQDGDYVRLNIDDVQIYNRKDNTNISIDMVDMGMLYLDIIDRYKYTPIIKEEIISEYIEDGDTVEFYPSRRIKLIDNGVEIGRASCRERVYGMG